MVDEDGLKADRLTLRLDDRGGRLEFPETDVTLGADASSLGYVGQYKVDAVSGEVAPATMTIGATAAGMTGSIRAPRSRSWEDMTLAQIAQKIAAGAGLIATVGQSLATVHFPFLAQTGESDLHFLTRIAHPLDATAKPAGGRLVVAKRGEGEASRAAEAELELAGRAVFKLTAQASGYWPSLFAGGVLDLPGLRPELNGKWQIMRVEHALEAGLTTSIEARKGK